MNRGYTAEQYLDKIRRLRELIPDIVLTSDIIVGFPGETTAEFEDTLRLIEAVGYDALFTFIYSPREGTPAAKMADVLTREEKSANFQRLLERQNEISAEKHAAYVGKTLRVLVDGVDDDGKHDLTGRTDGGRLVHLNGDASLIGGSPPLPDYRRLQLGPVRGDCDRREAVTWQSRISRKRREDTRICSTPPRPSASAPGSR